MADCIRQLLELEQRQQRETLMSLAQYAATKDEAPFVGRAAQWPQQQHLPARHYDNERAFASQAAPGGAAVKASDLEEHLVMNVSAARTPSPQADLSVPALRKALQDMASSLSMRGQRSTPSSVLTCGFASAVAQGLHHDEQQLLAMRVLSRLLDAHQLADSHSHPSSVQRRSSGPHPVLNPGPLSPQRSAAIASPASSVWSPQSTHPTLAQALVQQSAACTQAKVSPTNAQENPLLIAQQPATLRSHKPTNGSQLRSGPASGASLDMASAEGAANAVPWSQEVSYPLSATETKETSLRSYLNHLKHLDSGCILLARKINRLGFESAEILKAHYSSYGQVAQVFVPHSRSVAKSQSHRPFVRRRPSGIGFIVMNSSVAVDSILLDGDEQAVAGVVVQLQRFQPQRVMAGVRDE